MTDTENLIGGNSNQVQRYGNTVIRQCGAWSPFVHQLLQFLAANRFTESPILLETTSTTETLTYIEGEAGNDPLKPSMMTDNIVIEAAQLLRKFHDLSINFVVPQDAQFFLPIEPDNPHEVVCHNDFAPYNCVFKNGHIVGIIDFDTASPGSRLWDVAYAVYRFVPLATDDHCINLGWQSPPDRIHRLQVFCDAYQLEDSTKLIETVLQRLQTLIQFMRDTNSNLSHILNYLDDIAYIQENQQQFQDAL